MRQQVGRHERSVGMPTDRDLVGVGHATPDHFVHGRLSTGNELFDKLVVGFFIPFADNRHGRIIEHRVTHRQPQQRRMPTCPQETIRRVGDLPGSIGALVFLRVRPHQHRKRSILRRIARRKVQRTGQIDAIGALVANHFLADIFQLGSGVFKESDLLHLIVDQVAYKVIRLLGHRLPAGHKNLLVRVQQAHRLLIVGCF